MKPPAHCPQLTTTHTTHHSDADAAHLFAALDGPRTPHTALLESAQLHHHRPIKSILCLKSALLIQCHGKQVTARALTTTGTQLLTALAHSLTPYLQQATPTTATFYFPPPPEADEQSRLTAINPSQVLRQLQTLTQTLLPAPLGTLIGGFGYEYIDSYEKLQPVTAGENRYPDFEFNLAQHLLVIDHSEKLAHAYTFASEAETHDAETFVSNLKHVLAPATPAPSEPANTAPAEPTPEQHPTTSQPPLPVQTNIDDANYRQLVQELQIAIKNGDIYQVVPARTFRAPCPHPYRAYRELRRSNPSPYMFYFNGEDYTLFGASPESCLKYDATTRKVELYPIAGTRPRGKNADGEIDPEMDSRAELSLRTDAKELAEHIMLVDLARNDLARIAAPGTRQVERLLGVDRYSQVMHLVSHLTCTLAPTYDALDAYRACMNMGTLTGAPKIAATNLLRQAEKRRRGSYGGAVGYLGADGSLDTCIAIRSAYVTHGIAHVQAGAGVVRDSDPQAEADETYQKASAVLHALAAAQQLTKLEVSR